MRVDFGGDEPYAVEDLLIYLYTLEYPNRKSRKFEVPAVQEKAPKPAMPEATDTKTFKLKSETPRDLWQEHLALYRVGHRLYLTRLCQTTIRIVNCEISNALRGWKARQLIREIYDLDQPGTRILRERVATEIVEQQLHITGGLVLDDILLDYPVLGYNLINAMRANEKKLDDEIVTLQLDVDWQAKEIDKYRQQLVESKDKAKKNSELAAASERRLQEEKTKAARLSKTATQLRKELRDYKGE